ncbi:hypothetical protein [Streptomyces sp. SID13031]|uniref:hypothetical protein n=1 Tax=Streptomyces sp. SID13031 TaxID=2706046 RepID=UPI0013C98E3E|nr:hypothetical protein [Streptomyces sp. SID13031]NEA35650.1 hypothetical protein [Streptomyces sp. SID13031]
MSDNQLAVEVVRGEMQPWSDYNGKRGAVGGPVLRALLNDVLPAGARTLILGPHTADLVSVVVDKASSATMLVRSVSDASSLAEQFPDLQVIAGALDGLTGTTYETVVAVDGLDRVLGYDSDNLTWPERLDALAALCTPSTVLVLALENEFSLTSLLDRRPPSDRHGDDDWRPLHDDPARPVSAVQLASELARVGLPLQTVYSSFEDKTLLAVDVAAVARPGSLPARLAAEALETADVPLLAPIADRTESAARAGLLASTATGWLAITGASPQGAIYTKTGPAVLTATATTEGWSITATNPPATSSTPAASGTAGASGTHGGHGVLGTHSDGLDSAPAFPSVRDVFFDVSAVPSVVSGASSVETVLFRLAAAEDVPAFRALAGRLGEWALAQTGQVILRWDDITLDGDTFGFGVSGWVAEADRADLLAAAWQRFHDRLIGNHRRHPWPPWMIGDDLVSAWLAMSGAPTDVARGKELAAALAVALGTGETQQPDVRTALADAERAKQELFELQGHVFGLERTLGFRDKALKTRETRLREMRLQVQKTNAERTRFRNSRAFAAATLIRKAALIRNPRKFAYKVKRRLRKKLGNRF